jgi:hypothetical protein
LQVVIASASAPSRSRNGGIEAGGAHQVDVFAGKVPHRPTIRISEARYRRSRYID